MSAILTPEQALGDRTDQIIADLWDQLATYIQKLGVTPNFLYVNEYQWRDAPQKLHDMLHLLNVQVRTSKFMPWDGAFMTIDEFNADDLAKSLARGEHIGLI